MKIKFQNFTSRYNDIFLIPTIIISLSNPVRYCDIDFGWIIFYIGIRFEKKLKHQTDRIIEIDINDPDLNEPI